MGSRFVAAGVSLLLLAAPPAVGWGPRGHRIVARLASSRLTAAARAGVHQLLGHQTLAEVANWADEIRTSRPQTADWHFVDIPIGRDAYEPAIDCQKTPWGDCSIAAIGRQRARLSDPTTPRPDRIEALEFLTHLVADLHQPLHSADNHDAGGNAERVHFDHQTTRLHAVWDSGIIERTGLTESAYVKRLNSMLSTSDETKLAQGTVVEWALEAHAQAALRAYRDTKGHLITDDEWLGQAYYAASRPVVDRQLARAGVRLARVLNEAFAGP